MRRGALVLIALLSMLPLAGCQASNGAAVPASGPTSLYVTSSNPERESRPPPEGVVRDAATVDQLYRAALALPVVSERHNCPYDTGQVYGLIFQRGSDVVAQMELHVSGCRFLYIRGDRARMTDSAFRALFSKVTGMPLPAR